MFRIIAKCDPYNAKAHYYGQKVIRHDGPTPVVWVYDDNLGEGFTEEDAKEYLFVLAEECMENSSNGSWSWEDDESVAQLKVQAKEDLGDDYDESIFNWYKGEGIYNFQTLILKRGATSFEDDSVTYMVEKF